MLTINDLKEDELRLIFDCLSIKTLFKCRSVSHVWKSIIDDALQTRLTLTLHYNDITHFTNQERQSMCSNGRHIPINSSVGAILGKVSPFVSQFTKPNNFRDSFGCVFDLCANVESLNLLEVKLDLTDFLFILESCPRVQCLSVKVGNFMDYGYRGDYATTLKGIKHLRVKWHYPSGDVYSKTNDWLFLSQLTAIEELVIDMNFAISMESINDSMFDELKRLNARLNKLHLLNIKHVTDSEQTITRIIESLCDENTNKSESLVDLNIDCFAFRHMLEQINDRFINLETLYIRLDRNYNYRVSLKNLKNLRHLHLYFNSMTNSYDIEAQNDTNDDNQYLTILSNINPLITTLTISNSSCISINTFVKTGSFLPNLQRLDTYMVSFEGNSIEFWKIIADFKYLQKLTLNLTCISDDGCEQLIRSDSLNTIELVKYKGVSAMNDDIWISTDKILNTCAQLAIEQPNKWITLRLDIDIYEVDQQVNRFLPRNLRVLNVGWKK